MKVKLYTDKEYDITSWITSDIQCQARRDLVFAEGSFSMTTSDITYNIPSYSPLIIVHDNLQEEHYMACSEAHYDAINGVWNHDVRMLDASSILATWILDTKTFSDRGSYAKTYQQMAICCLLIMEKEKVNIKLGGNNASLFKEDRGNSDIYVFSNTFNQVINTSIPNGSNLWTALCLLANDYNKVPQVRLRDVVSAYDLTYSIEFIDVNDNFSFRDKHVIDEGCYQNENEYCRTIESAITDVVDRTTINRFENLVCKAESSIITDSSAYLEIPCRVERITKLEVVSKNGIPGQYSITITNMTSVSLYSSDTWGHWIQGYKDNEIQPIIAKLNELGIVIPNDASVVKIHEGTRDDWNVMFDLPLAVDFSIIEKSQWDILEEKEKPKYCYYQKYNNKIENLYSPYRTDLWNSIVSAINNDNGTTNGPLEDGNERWYDVNEYSGKIVHTIKIKTMLSDSNPTAYTYNVECIPVVDMYIRDYKSNENIINESQYKPSSITYNGANGMVDFDRVVKDIKKTNEGRGRMQRTFTLINTPLRPNVAQKIIYDSVEWYITTVTSTYDSLDNSTHVLECSMTPIKVAEAVGLMTQYESTPNPLDNYVDRHIYIDVESVVNISSKNTYIKFHFNFKNGTSTELLKRAVAVNAEDKTYLIVEALDNYALDTYSIKANNSSVSIKRYMQDAPYVDAKNEIESFSYEIIYLGDVTQEQAFNIVNETSLSHSTLYSSSDYPIYKDARERLIFTFMLNNSNVIDDMLQLVHPIITTSYENGYSYMLVTLKNPNVVKANCEVTITREGETTPFKTYNLQVNKNDTKSVFVSFDAPTKDYEYYTITTRFVGNGNVISSQYETLEVATSAIQMTLRDPLENTLTFSRTYKNWGLTGWCSSSLNTMGWKTEDGNMYNVELDAYIPLANSIRPITISGGRQAYYVTCERYSEMTFYIQRGDTVDTYQFIVARYSTWDDLVNKYDFGFRWYIVTEPTHYGSKVLEFVYHDRAYIVNMDNDVYIVNNKTYNMR